MGTAETLPAPLFWRVLQAIWKTAFLTSAAGALILGPFAMAAAIKPGRISAYLADPPWFVAAGLAALVVFWSACLAHWWIADYIDQKWSVRVGYASKAVVLGEALAFVLPASVSAAAVDLQAFAALFVATVTLGVLLAYAVAVVIGVGRVAYDWAAHGIGL